MLATAKWIKIAIFMIFIGSVVFFAFSFYLYRSNLTYFGENMYGYGYWLVPNNENISNVNIFHRYDGTIINAYSEGTDSPRYFVTLDTDNEEITVELPDMVKDNSISLITRSGSDQNVDTLDCALCLFGTLLDNIGSEVSIEVKIYGKENSTSYISRVIIYEQ
jgi:hypothetical protein